MEKEYTVKGETQDAALPKGIWLNEKNAQTLQRFKEKDQGQEREKQIQDQPRIQVRQRPADYNWGVKHTNFRDRM